MLLAAPLPGTPFLCLFAISLQALRIAGRLTVAVAGWQMLHEEDHKQIRIHCVIVVFVLGEQQ